MAQQTGIITIEKPYYGWIPTMSTSLTRAFESTETTLQQGVSQNQQYSWSTAMMPNRPGYEGHLAPGPAFIAAQDGSSVVNGLALNATVANDGKVYVILDSNRYVTLDPVFNLQQVSPTVYGTIGTTAGLHSGHAGFTTVNGDVVNFATSGTANAYAYFSWEDTTDADIAKYSGTTGTANFYTADCGGSALAKGLPHPLLVGQDRFLYIGNGNLLAKCDPKTPSGSANDAALTLPPYWQIQGLSQYQNYIAAIAWQQNTATNINANLKGQSMLFLWDGVATSWNFQYDIQDFFVSNAYYDGVNLYVITYGRNNTVKLKLFNGSSFDILWESANIGNFPAGINSYNPCFGGIDLWLNHLTWTSQNNTNINAFGSPSPKDVPAGFHQIGSLAGNNGMCKNLFQSTLFVGNKNGSNYTIQYSDLSQFGTNTQYISPFYALPTNSSIDYIKLYFSQWGSAAALKVGLMKDYDTFSFGGSTDLLNWNPTTANVGTAISYAYISRSIKNINGFYLGTKWTHTSTSNTAAIIRKVEVGYNWDDQNI